MILTFLDLAALAWLAEQEADILRLFPALNEATSCN